MNKEEFNKAYSMVEKQAKEVMLSKQAHYSEENDVFSNFRKAAEMNNTGMLNIIWAYATKHIIAVSETLSENIWDDYEMTMLKEHLTDIHNYIVYLQTYIS